MTRRLLSLFVVCAFLGACKDALPITKTSCSVIETAHSLCLLIRTAGPDGGFIDTPVPVGELQNLTPVRAAMKQGLAQDGGCP